MHKSLALAFSLLCLTLPASAQHLIQELTGQLFPGSPQIHGGFGQSVVWIGDVDQDGHDDYAVSAPNASVIRPVAGSVLAFSGRTGAELWAAHGTTSNTRWGLGGLSNLGFIDGDAVPDIGVSTDGLNAVILSGADGSVLHSTPAIGSFNGRRIKPAGNLDGDGVADYLLSFGHEAHVFSGATHALLRTHAAPSDVIVRTPSEMLGDLDQDGRDDYAVMYSCGFTAQACLNGYEVYSGASGAVLHSNVTGPFPAGVDIFWSVTPAGDFDGDSIPDFDLYSSVFDVYTGFGTTSHDLHSGASGLALGVFPQPGVSGFFGVVGDLNGDTVPEFLDYEYTSLPIVRDGATLSALHVLEAAPNDSTGFGTAIGLGGDADGDGFGDIIVTQRVGNINVPIPGRAHVFSGNLQPVSEAFCFGDGGVSPGCTPCACGNDAAVSDRGGCLNDVATSGRLFAKGIVSVADDWTRLEVRSANPSNLGILLSGANSQPNVGPCPPGSGVSGSFLDGLRCLSGPQLRHGGRISDTDGSIGLTTPGWGAGDGPSGGLLTHTGLAAGQTRYFQVFYRVDAALGCGTGINTTNAVALTPRP